MDDMMLVRRIKAFALSQPQSIPFEPVSETEVQDAEKELGFSIPRLLRLCYLIVGNGGFGPGYGLIGLAGGNASDYGTVVETYRTLQETLVIALRDVKGSREEQGITLLPFCEFGCNMYACVDCKDTQYALYSLEEGRLFRENYSLHRFFEMWIDGIDYSSEQEAVEVVEQEVINPFTKKKTIVRTRRRRR